MVGRGSPRFIMAGRGSPRLSMAVATASVSAARKRKSPKVNGTKKLAGSPRGKSRASWNPALEKSLVVLLHEHNTPGFRGDNGWSSEAWNKIVKEFHERNRYVSFTKAQIQEKEKELKRDYKMLKEARRQSGCHWNEDRCMIEAEPSLWDNLTISFPKAKKFRNNKSSFPLFDSLGELYDGHLAEGTYNITSSMVMHDMRGRFGDATQPTSNFGETLTYDVEDIAEVQGNEDPNNESMADSETREANDEVELVTAASNVQRSQTRPAPPSRNRAEKEKKRPRSSRANLEEFMQSYLEIALRREASQEKEKEQGSDFSIKRCVSVLGSMDVTRDEKIRAYGVFKKQENREIFLSSFEEDPDLAIMWLRSEMS